MASLTGAKFTIRCRNCWHGINFKLPADGKPDAMVECSCGTKAGLYGNLRLAADGEAHSGITAALVPIRGR